MSTTVPQHATIAELLAELAHRGQAVDESDPAVLKALLAEARAAGDAWKRYAEWRASRRSGLSSQFMAMVLLDHSLPADYAHPHDAGDFERCMHFLECFPEARQRLDRMVAHGRVWARLVGRWDAIAEHVTSGNEYRAGVAIDACLTPDPVTAAEHASAPSPQEAP